MPSARYRFKPLPTAGLSQPIQWLGRWRADTSESAGPQSLISIIWKKDHALQLDPRQEAARESAEEAVYWACGRLARLDENWRLSAEGHARKIGSLRYPQAHGIRRYHADRIFSDAEHYLRPPTLLLTPETTIQTFQELKSAVRGGERLLDRHDAKGGGAIHVSIEKRINGLLGQFGRIYPRSVGIEGAGNCSCDSMFVDSHGRAIAIEVMAYGDKWHNKRRLAVRFRDAAIPMLFLLARPPWEPPQRESFDAFLWSPHGPMPFRIEGDSEAIEHREDPPCEGMLYLSEPELCEPDGQLLIAKHLGFELEWSV